MSDIEVKVIQKIAGRAARGEIKYGVTMEREDLTLTEWLTHLQEELLDASVYVEKLLGIVSEVKEATEGDDFPLL